MSSRAARPLTGFLQHNGKFFFRFRNALFPVIFLVAALIPVSPRFGENPSADRIAMAAGVAIALAGELVRVVTIGLAYIQRGGKNGRVSADELVCTGIFAHSRNPMYFGNILIAAGACLVHGSLWMFVFVLPFFLFVYLAIVAEEERFLTERFGERYQEYCRRVNRFRPSLRGLSATFKEFQFDVGRVVVKEYGTFCALLIGLHALILWKYARIGGLASLSAHPLPVSAPLAVFVALYVTARFFKKTGRITARTDR